MLFHCKQCLHSCNFTTAQNFGIINVKVNKQKKCSAKFHTDIYDNILHSNGHIVIRDYTKRYIMHWSAELIICSV